MLNEHSTRPNIYASTHTHIHAYADKKVGVNERTCIYKYLHRTPSTVYTRNGFTVIYTFLRTFRRRFYNNYILYEL